MSDIEENDKKMIPSETYNKNEMVLYAESQAVQKIDHGGFENLGLVNVNPMVRIGNY